MTTVGEPAKTCKNGAATVFCVGYFVLCAASPPTHCEPGQWKRGKGAVLFNTVLAQGKYVM